MASLKNTIEGDRMTLGLRQTRGLAGSHSPSMQRMKTAFHEDDKSKPKFSMALSNS